MNKFILVEIFVISIKNFFRRYYFKRCSEKCYYNFVAVTESSFSGTSFTERFRFVSKHKIKQSFIYGFKTSFRIYYVG